jgi:hypothetical protein
VQQLSEVIAVTTGYNFCLALKKDGTVWGWGRNQYFGELGVGHNTTLPVGSVVRVNNLTNITGIDAGADYSLAVTAEGRVWAWGGNSSGQLGTQESEFTLDRYEPVEIIGLSDVKAVSAGVLHSLALKKDGTVWAWGSNWNGQLGNGSSGPCYSFARPITGLSEITAIAAGGSQSLALKSDGTIWTWGSNNGGQLGDGSLLDRNLPNIITGLTGVNFIAAGGKHSLAIIQGHAEAELPFPVTQNPTNGVTTPSASPEPPDVISTPVAIKPAACCLTINVSGSGGARGEGSYEVWTKAIISAVAAEGWVFTTWSGDISTVNDLEVADTWITMNRDCIITANFALQEKRRSGMTLRWMEIIGGVILLGSLALIYRGSRFRPGH